MSGRSILIFDQNGLVQFSGNILSILWPISDCFTVLERGDSPLSNAVRHIFVRLVISAYELKNRAWVEPKNTLIAFLTWSRKKITI